jgi:cobalt-zinc-cadmium efflux system membrane fusion protein
MKSKLIILVSFMTIAFLPGCASDEGHEHLSSSDHDHGEPEDIKEPKGPHGGKLFEKDSFGIEVTIYEPDIPPQSRVYVYKDGALIDPGSVTLVTELHRIDRVDTLQYKKQDAYLIGDKVVEEPHSFDVILNATYEGKKYSWSYSSYEGRTTLSNEAIASSGIEVEKATGATISRSVVLNGQVRPNKFKVSALSARFPGVLKEIRKMPGDKVQRGEVLATIEASDSLKAYDLVSPMSGEVLDLSAAVGELISNAAPLVTVGDLSSVWVELSVPRSDFSKLKVGQKIIIESVSPKHDGEAEGRIVYLSPLADTDTQTRIARAEVPNLTRALIPEVFIEGKVIVEERHVPVAIKAEALQTFRDWDVVFKKVGQNFEIAILELGEVDGDWIEVKEGLTAGTEYVTKNSFVIKADVMKSGATHDH